MKDKSEKTQLAKISILLIGIIALLLFTSINRKSYIADGKLLRIMFYNVENLFDTLNSDLDDDEFLPDGERRWNAYKYARKLSNTSKVIISAGNWEPPSIIGLCEVENIGVIADLVSETILSEINYEYIFAETADERGIGLALIYKDDFTLLSNKVFYPVDSSGDTLSTRTVMYAELADDIDTLALVVSHWPSRWGGVSATEELRKIVAGLIREEILLKNNHSKIILMGDLNCGPDSELIKNMIQPLSDDQDDGLFINPSRPVSLSGMGSYKYQGRWLQYDQIILSKELLDADRGYSYIDNSFAIIHDSYLLTDDKSYRGLKPLSTWTGPIYRGGFSDHLPVIIDLVSKD